MNKLTIEQKKVIVEKVMGWDFWLSLENFNPDQDLTQFVEMIGAFSCDLHDKFEEYICENYEIFLSGGSSLGDFNWLCKHKYEVCMAVIEVLK